MYLNAGAEERGFAARVGGRAGRELRGHEGPRELPKSGRSPWGAWEAGPLRAGKCYAQTIRAL